MVEEEVKDKLRTRNYRGLKPVEYLPPPARVSTVPLPSGKNRIVAELDPRLPHVGTTAPADGSYIWINPVEGTVTFLLGTQPTEEGSITLARSVGEALYKTAQVMFTQTLVLQEGKTIITQGGQDIGTDHHARHEAGGDDEVNIFDVTVPTTIQPDDAAATGSAVVASRRDHKHAIVAAAPSNIGTSNSEGSGTSFTRNDHVHNHPSGLGVDLHHSQDHAARHQNGGADEISVAGLSGELADMQKPKFDATLPNTVEPDDAAAAGSASTAARIDHEHAIVAAAASDIGTSNTEGSATSFARSDHGHSHPAGLPVALDGNDAAKPAAGVYRRLYYATDTGILYRDTGSAWEEILRAEIVTRLASLSEKAHASLTGVTADLHHNQDHATRHSSGGDDEVDHGNLAGLGDDDHTQYHKSAGDAGTGQHDFGGATSFEIPNNTNPSLDAAGEIAVDTAGTYMSGQNTLVFYDGSQKLYVLASDEAVADREIPVYDDTSGKIQWEPHRINTNLPHIIEERASDPGDPAEGTSVIWQSNGTGSGDDGDILIKITAGATTKTTTLVDFSAI